MRVLLLCMLVGAAAAFAPLLKVDEPIAERYIVKLKGNADLENVISKVRLHEVFDKRVEVRHTFRKVFSGFSARLTDSLVSMLRNLDAVEYIEQEGVVRASAVASWGLDRVDQLALPLDDSYTPIGNGAGAHVYVLDTGINPTHVDFGGRAEAVFDPINDGQNGIDCNGHGTHCAGTIAGTTYGVANGVNVYGLRVLNCGGSGSTADITAADDWVAANGIRPAVASMSLGGGASQASDDGVMGMINAGVQVAVAAGNEDTYACTKSPARTIAAVTVGATDSTDTRASFSNFGACVDIFAPGVSITSAWYDSDTSTNTISGTSMACPHVAGALAVLHAADSSLTPAELKAAIQAKSISDKVIDAVEYSPNLLLYVGNGNGGGSVPEAFGPNTACGTTVTTSGTIITPPGFPFYTGDNLNCGYLLSAPAGSNVRVTFNYFAVEDRALNRCWDTLDIHDGSSSAASLIVSGCGSGIPGPYTSTGSDMYLNLVTDTSVGFPGFEALVEFV
ncbi:extracellular serine proteinase-like [Apostichopus japonicus]